MILTSVIFEWSHRNTSAVDTSKKEVGYQKSPKQNRGSPVLKFYRCKLSKFNWINTRNTEQQLKVSWKGSSSVSITEQHKNFSFTVCWPSAVQKGKIQDTDTKLRRCKTLLMTFWSRPENVHFQASLRFEETDAYSNTASSTLPK